MAQPNQSLTPKKTNESNFVIYASNRLKIPLHKKETKKSWVIDTEGAVALPEGGYQDFEAISVNEEITQNFIDLLWHNQLDHVLSKQESLQFKPLLTSIIFFHLHRSILPTWFKLNRLLRAKATRGTYLQPPIYLTNRSKQYFPFLHHMQFQSFQKSWFQVNSWPMFPLIYHLKKSPWKPVKQPSSQKETSCILFFVCSDYDIIQGIPLILSTKKS